MGTSKKRGPKLSKAAKTVDEPVGAVEGVKPGKTGINETMVSAAINDAKTGKHVWFARKEKEVRRFTPTKDEHHGDLIYNGFPIITKFDIMRAGWEEKPARKLTHFESVIELSELEIEALNSSASSGKLMTCSDIGRIVETRINVDKENQDADKAQDLDKESYSVTPDTWFAVWEHEKTFRAPTHLRYENISGAIEFWRNELDNIHSGEMPFQDNTAFQMMERNKLSTEKGSKVVYFKQFRNAKADYMHVAKVEFEEVIRKSDEVETEEVVRRSEEEDQDRRILESLRLDFVD